MAAKRKKPGNVASTANFLSGESAIERRKQFIENLSGPGHTSISTGSLDDVPRAGSAMNLTAATPNFTALQADGQTALSVMRAEKAQLQPDKEELEKKLSQKRRNKAQTLNYSNALLDALSEAVEYDLTKHHNQPPPALRISDDPKYIDELRSLITELKRLNDLLEQKKPKFAEATRTAIDFNKHVNSFFNAYMPAMGKGVAGLMIGAIAGMLLHLGLPEATIGGIWSLRKLASGRSLL